MRHLSHLLTVSVLAGLGAASGLSASPSAVIGLDHIPIAVNDLEQAAARYRALGFALKPGTPHGNGIRNQHVKFPDGTELELITAPEARDGLTAKYRKHLANGDGPAFLAFYTQAPAQVAEQLTALHIAHQHRGPLVDVSDTDPLDYLFFGGRNKSPTDRPGHFAHANTAESLIGVWLAVGKGSTEERLLARLGATVRDEEREAPGTWIRARVARLPEGEVLFLPAGGSAGRPIVGATVRVRDLSSARRVLDRDAGIRTAIVTKRGASSIFLPPAVTHGLWLEFRQVRGR